MQLAGDTITGLASIRPLVEKISSQQHSEREKKCVGEGAVSMRVSEEGESEPWNPDLFVILLLIFYLVTSVHSIGFLSLASSLAILATAMSSNYKILFCKEMYRRS